MKDKRPRKFWLAAAQFLPGCVAMSLLTFVCFRYNANSTTVALLYLIVAYGMKVKDGRARRERAKELLALSTSNTRRAGRRAHSPAASSSAWRWHERWPPTRPSCCSRAAVGGG